ncbi:MAG: hypothetical protein B9S33_00495 [Pedosphaera sp. Tous-C6FEB]|nr:MAG: hypothetical protein B9S33_00495 [Pedosphaera sp. Tous-C6FEB]
MKLPILQCLAVALNGSLVFAALSGAATVKLVKPHEHWSFQPLMVPAGAPSIDSFITAMLCRALFNCNETLSLP